MRCEIRKARRAGSVSGGAGSAASEDARVCKRRRRFVRSQRYKPRHGRLSKAYCLRCGSANPSDETERTASRTEARRIGLAHHNRQKRVSARDWTAQEGTIGWLKTRASALSTASAGEEIVKFAGLCELTRGFGIGYNTGDGVERKITQCSPG